MNLWTQPLGPIETNAYVLSNDQGQGIVIDPGMNPEPLLAHIETLDIVAILLTHAHFDHIGGVEDVRKKTGAPVYVHDLEADWLTDPQKNGSARWSEMMDPIRCQPRDESLADGQRLSLAGITLEVRHTPGHSPGSVSFYLPEHGTVIAGDTLFAGSIGRTDLPGGDHATLLESIRQQLFVLPDETNIYPGHGSETTIGDEKKFNPFLSGL